MPNFATTTRTREQIARRGNNICEIDETLTPVRKNPAVDARTVPIARSRRVSAMVPSLPSVFIPRAPSRSVRVVAEPNPFDGDTISAVKELARHQGSFARLSSNAQKGLAKSLAIYVLHNPELWESFTMDTKKAIALIAMDWHVDTDEPNVAICRSIHSKNLYAITFDPATGETACQRHTHQNTKTGKWEGGCTAFCTGKMCYHRLCFDVIIRPEMVKHFAEFYPHLLGPWYVTESASSETESIHRQESESNDYNRARIDEIGASLMNAGDWIL